MFLCILHHPASLASWLTLCSLKLSRQCGNFFSSEQTLARQSVSTSSSYLRKNTDLVLGNVHCAISAKPICVLTYGRHVQNPVRVDSEGDLDAILSALSRLQPVQNEPSQMSIVACLLALPCAHLSACGPSLRFAKRTFVDLNHDKRLVVFVVQVLACVRERQSSVARHKHRHLAPDELQTERERCHILRPLFT
jgi:hypothetical protein